MGKSIIVKMIPMIDACDLPGDVEDYCVENEIQTHYQNDVAFVEDDGNVFAEWLKEIGIEFLGASDIQVAIQAT